MKYVLMALVLSLGLSSPAFDWRPENPVDVCETVASCPELDFPDGFKATVRFAVDLEKVNRKSKFANLFCKGQDFHDGYCAMVRHDGSLLIDIKGIEPQYYLYPAHLESNREYELQLYVTPKCVRVFIDGTERGSYSYDGRLGYVGNGMPLKIGTMGGYRFCGRLSHLKLEALADVTLPSGGPAPALRDPPAKQARAEIKWAKPICVEKDRYIGWPSVCRLANGDLLAVFSGDRDTHVCPWGKVQMVRSTDDGETWSGPVTIANGPIDDRDAGILQMPDGEVIVTYFTSMFWSRPEYLKKHREWARHLEKISPGVRKTSEGDFLIRSYDNGKTWTKPEKLDANYTQSPHGPIVLKDGALLQIGRVVTPKKTLIRVSRSDDRGKSWKMLCGEVPDMNGENDGTPQLFCEPHAVECADGTLVGLVRYHGADNCMRLTRSTDGGSTWSPMEKTPMLGLPPHLIALPDGKLVAVYGRRFAHPGFGNFACISDDGGRTWDAANEIMLMPATNGDLGYPASALLPNGDIVTVYYQRRDGATSLFATKWRVVR